MQRGCGRGMGHARQPPGAPASPACAAGARRVGVVWQQACARSDASAQRCPGMKRLLLCRARAPPSARASLRGWRRHRCGVSAKRCRRGAELGGGVAGGARGAKRRLLYMVRRAVLLAVVLWRFCLPCSAPA